MYDIIELNNNDVASLQEIAKKLGIANHKKLAKQDLIFKILDRQALMTESELASLQADGANGNDRDCASVFCLGAGDNDGF